MKFASSSYRVVHLPNSVGGNSQGLSSHLKKLGVDSETWIFEQNTFNYSSTKIIWDEGDGRLRKEAKRFLAIINVAFNFDIIHFNFGSSLSSPIPMFSSADKGLSLKIKRLFQAVYLELLFLFEMNLYRMLRRPLFVHYQGDDARQGDYSLNNFQHSIAQYVDKDYYRPETDALKRRMIRRMSRYCIQVYTVNPDLMRVLSPKARFVPYSHISLEEWQPVYTQLEKRPLRIGHAPSHRKVKGTEIILNALEQLSTEGYEFELVLIEGLPNHEARLKYEEIDILIDQLHAGWYGGLAVEAMALGKPVMAYIRKEDLQFIPPEMCSDLPVLCITAETLKDDLRRMLQMSRNDLLGLAKQSRQYVERWHDPLRIAKEIALDYRNALGSR